MYRRSAISLGALTLVGGCLASPERSAATTVERAQSTTESSVVGTVETKTTIEGELTRERTIDVWWRPDRRLRQEARESADSTRSLLIAADSETWFHLSESNRTIHLDYQIADEDPFSYRSVVDRLDEYEVVDSKRTDVAERSAEYLDCRPESLRTVPEVEYYTFRIGPALGSAVVPRRIELWIDEDTGYPLSQTLYTDVGRSTTEFSWIEFDRDIPDERFDFDPPPDSTVVDTASALATRHDTLEEAELHAGFRLGVPESIDGGYDLEHATVGYGEDVTSIRASYAGADEQLSIAGEPLTDGRTVPDGETISIGDVEATLVETDPDQTDLIDRHLVTVFFACNDIEYVVNGSTHEDVRSIAAAVECV